MEKIKFTLIAMLAIMMSMASCDSDDDDTEETTAAELVAGDYSGKSAAVFAYTSVPILINGEQLTLTANDDGTCDAVLTSSTWGTATFPSAQVSADGTTYTVSGSGTIAIVGHSGVSSSYDCTLTGTVTDGDPVFVVTVPSLMGGTTITFTSGEYSDAEMIAGDYSGSTSATIAYSSEPIVTENDTLAITANDDGTCDVVLISSTWGTATFPSAQVSADGTTYTVSGSGTIAIVGHSGVSSSYDCTLTGTVTSGSPSFVVSIPSLMGGTKITFE